MGLYIIIYLPTLTHNLCRSKIVISCIQTNFSHLTDNGECNCLKTDQIKIQLFI